MDLLFEQRVIDGKFLELLFHDFVREGPEAAGYSIVKFNASNYGGPFGLFGVIGFFDIDFAGRPFR